MMIEALGLTYNYIAKKLNVRIETAQGWARNNTVQDYACVLIKNIDLAYETVANDFVNTNKNNNNKTVIAYVFDNKKLASLFYRIDEDLPARALSVICYRIKRKLLDLNLTLSMKRFSKDTEKKYNEYIKNSNMSITKSSIIQFIKEQLN